MAKIDREEQLANPEVSSLITPDSLYRREMILVLQKIMMDQLERLPSSARARISDTQIKSVLRELRNTPTKGLENRVAAIQGQNPGALAEAMKALGYGIRKDVAGNVAIDIDGSSAMGAHISPEQFEAIKV